MNPLNYHLEMGRQMARIPKGTPLLLHACCAPCASVALERLAPHFDITLYYYNPNIQPLEEHRRREAALEKLVGDMAGALPKPLEILFEPWAPERFLEVAAGLEDQPEGGARCAACFELRLRKTADTARRLGIHWMATTLTVGPRKAAGIINPIGQAAAQGAGLDFLCADLKKQDGYKRSVALCAEYGVYRQSYCGCGMGEVSGSRL